MTGVRRAFAAFLLSSTVLCSGAAYAGLCSGSVAVLAPAVSEFPVTALTCAGPQVLVIDMNGRAIKTVALALGYSVVSTFLYPDLNGDEVPEVGVLLEDSATEAINRIEIVDVVTGVVVKRIRVRR